MTAEMMLGMLEELETAGDVTIDRSTTEINVTFHNFIGFTDDWEEEYRIYELPNLVELVEDIVEELGSGNMYKRAILDNITFVFGYTSYEI